MYNPAEPGSVLNACVQSQSSCFPGLLPLFLSSQALQACFSTAAGQRWALHGLMKDSCQQCLLQSGCALGAERGPAAAIVGWWVKRAASAWLTQCSLSHFSKRCLPSFQAITRANTQHLSGTLHHTLLFLGYRGQETLPACTGWNDPSWNAGLIQLMPRRAHLSIAKTFPSLTV